MEFYDGLPCEDDSKPAVFIKDGEFIDQYWLLKKDTDCCRMLVVFVKFISSCRIINNLKLKAFLKTLQEE
jgi:hypothetical protein